MVALRKAAAYSKKAARPFTRHSKKSQRSYIKTIPQIKITKFNMGDSQGYERGTHKYAVLMISDQKIQIRDNALESCRMLLNKILERELAGQYYFAIKVFPHHLLRENKIAAGAGADRLSSGMRHSFGIVVGRAAMVRPGQTILFVTTPDERTARIARTAMEMIKAKVPCKTRIIFEKRDK
jgi:large subunit ribosomal protein L10e